MTLVDCPAGIDEVNEHGLVVDGKQYDVDCIVYGTGFEPELTPLFRRAGHDIIGRGGVSLAEKWADGPATLFGMMTRGFPNLFMMPAPAQQAVVTVNYTQLAVLGAEFVGGDGRHPRAPGREGVRRERRRRGGVDAEDRRRIRRRAAQVMSACTPSRINAEGNPKAINPRNGNYGRGLGDYFGYRELLEQWLEQGDCEGLELDVRFVAS